MTLYLSNPSNFSVRSVMSAIPVISSINCYFYYYISLLVVVAVAILVIYFISSSMIIIIIVMCYPQDDINVQDIISSGYHYGFMGGFVVYKGKIQEL